MEGPNVLRLWNPSMVAVIANANGFRTAALDTQWTTAKIRGDNLLIQPVSPNRLSLPVRVWFAMRHSALFEIVTSRFVLDISPEIPGVHTFHSTAEAAQRTPSDAEVLPMMVRLLKETYGDRLFLVYAAEPSLTSTQPEPEETETLLQCRMQGVRCASTGPYLREALQSLQYFGSGFSNSAPGKRPLQRPRTSPRRRTDLVRVPLAHRGSCALVVFTSWAFVGFFLCVLSALALVRSRTSRQLIILVASIFFYGYWNKLYLLLLAAPSIIDYNCAILIEASNQPRRRKFWVVVSLASNLGLLAYFKYANFFLSNIATWFGRDFEPLDIALPIGISFYTFKTLSYTIDVYRAELPACRDWWKYAMFVTYFPELIAGPIVRASVFLPQMTRSLKPSGKRAIVGLELILLGVTKKLLIADRMAVLADAVFEHPHFFSPLTVASGVVAYSLQIYCDFSGYSDIAIGVSRIIGFDLPENFNMPYLSTSITEFWRRWHMTLSKWLRDYLYIPLGGNRRGRFRTYFNLLMTMLLGGLWHGAN